MMETEHNEEYCGTDRCPRCAKVYELLQRFQIQQSPPRHTELFQLAEYAVELGEVAIKHRMRYVPGKVSGELSIQKVEVYPENIARLSANYESFLIDDGQFEEALKAGAYRGHRYKVYLENFVCRKDQQETQIHDVSVTHTALGLANFMAQATRVAVDVTEKHFVTIADIIFEGYFHLAVFANKELLWAAKNLACVDRGYETLVKGRLYLDAPRFVAADIVNKQDDTMRFRACTTCDF